MSNALLLLPDFLLILSGLLICRFTPMGRSVWDSAERLVYYVLFPALLFTAILRNPLQPGTLWPLALCGVAVMALRWRPALSCGDGSELRRAAPRHQRRR